jgi:glycerol-3-phosphate dehydrogenase
MPHLKAFGLKGAWEYWDGLMDDRALGLWAAEQAHKARVTFRTHTPVSRVAASGDVIVQGHTESFDRVINAAGPWAARLLEASHIESDHRLDLVRGSHLVINRRIECGCVLQEAGSRRVIFVLPQGEHALLGTTEVMQIEPSPTVPSETEILSLVDAYGRAFEDALTPADIVKSFAGVRPVVHSVHDVSAASREAVIEIRGRVVTIFGGKWTSARVLANRVVQAVMTGF